VADSGDVVAIHHPVRRTTPLVFASPHSGRTYSDSFLRQSCLSLAQLRRSEDAFIDELFAAAPSQGAPLVHALFPRVFLDPNRSVQELDPRLFRDLPADHSHLPTARALAGLGIIPRLGAEGQAIYRARLAVSEARERIDQLYAPYHAALESQIRAAERQFGLAILIDAHSMPSRGTQHVDVVIGDRHGSSSAPAIVDRVEAALHACGFRTARNTPYAGGHSTEHYGRPLLARHAIQLEINRGLYLDERRVTRSGTFEATRMRLSRFIAAICAENWSDQTR
tara:strand:- start:1062 stop:1904 length:843 start_codon:yes stop_codon:yes gene_type:complete